jgi:hypothetical protein
MQVLLLSAGGGRALGLGQEALVGEVDDLDRLAARERHTLREMPVVALCVHLFHPLPPVSEMGRAT